MNLLETIVVPPHNGSTIVELCVLDNELGIIINMTSNVKPKQIKTPLLSDYGYNFLWMLLRDCLSCICLMEFSN